MMHVIQSSLMQRVNFPNGRPEKFICAWGDNADLRCQIHESAHAVACDVMLVPFTGLRKDKDYYITECDLRKEPRPIDLAVSLAGPCGEQIFRVEDKSDIGLDGDFDDCLLRLKRDRVPTCQWRDEFQRAFAKAASIVENDADVILAIARAFAKVDFLSAPDCRQIIHETRRKRPVPRPWWMDAPSTPTAEPITTTKRQHNRRAVVRRLLPTGVVGMFRHASPVGGF